MATPSAEVAEGQPIDILDPEVVNPETGTFPQLYRMLVNRKRRVSGEYDLKVPDDAEGRLALVNMLKTLYARGLTKVPGFKEGEMPVEGGRPSPDTLYQADIEKLVAVLGEVLPPVEREDFAEALRRRVNAQEGLLRGGALEALGVIVRFYVKSKDTEQTLKRAQSLTRSARGTRGEIPVKDLPPADLASVLGARIVKLDDEIRTPAVFAENVFLYEGLVTKFVDFGDSLKAVTSAFDGAVDKFAQTQAAFRYTDFLRAQWSNTLFKRLMALDITSKSLDVVQQELQRIATDLSGAKDPNAFVQVINNVGKSVPAN